VNRGHDRDAADLFESLGDDRIVRRVGPHLESGPHEHVGRRQRLGRIGNSVPSSPITSSLTALVSNASRASSATLMASPR